MYVPITTFNIGYPVERPWKRLPYYYSTLQKIARGYFNFFALFSGKSFSPPRKTNKPGRKLCRAVSDSSSLTWEWAFRLPQDGCFPQKQLSEPEFQDKAYLHRI